MGVRGNAVIKLAAVPKFMSRLQNALQPRVSISKNVRATSMQPLLISENAVPPSPLCGRRQQLHMAKQSASGMIALALALERLDRSAIPSLAKTGRSAAC